MKINNDLSYFHPTNEREWVEVILLGLSAAGIISAFIMLINAVFFGVLPLLVLLGWPIGQALYNGNLGEALGSKLAEVPMRHYPYDVRKQPEISNREKTWRTYEKLPAEVKRDLPSITPEMLIEMDADDVNQVKEKMNNLSDAYHRQQKALKRPEVVELLRSIGNAEKSYNSVTSEIMELTRGDH